MDGLFYTLTSGEERPNLPRSTPAATGDFDAGEIETAYSFVAWFRAAAVGHLLCTQRWHNEGAPLCRYRKSIVTVFEFEDRERLSLPLT